MNPTTAPTGPGTDQATHQTKPVGAMPVAGRLRGIETSPIRTISEGAPPGAIPLGLGQPGWPMAEVGWQALVGQGSGNCGYSPHAGLEEIRDALAERHRVTHAEVFVTCGAEGAFANLFTAWLGIGDRVLVPDPGFVAYPTLARLCDAEPIPYPLVATNFDGRVNYRLDADEIISRLDTERLKVVVLNHPSNPTGGGATTNQLRRVAEACEERSLLLISDEVYRELTIGQPQPSLRETGLGVVVESLSKAWAAPGLRIGWCVGDPRWLQPARVVQGFTVIAAATPSQRAATALLRAGEPVLEEGRRQLRVRWSALREAMAEHLPDVAPIEPDGGFYSWLPLPHLNSVGSGSDAMTFCLRARDEAGVVLIPGSAFGFDTESGRSASGHFRLSFATEPTLIREGIRRLATIWREAG